MRRSGDEIEKSIRDRKDNMCQSVKDRLINDINPSIINRVEKR